MLRVEDAARASMQRHEALDRATMALLELAEDFRIDAVKRLRERGASEAQVEGYERAYREKEVAVKAAAEAATEAHERLGSSVQALLHGD